MGHQTVHTTPCSTLLVPYCSSGFDSGKTPGVLNAFSDRLRKTGHYPKEMGRLLKHAETFRYVADYGVDPVELSDAPMVAQAETFLATIQAQFTFLGIHPP